MKLLFDRKAMRAVLSNYIFLIRKLIYYFPIIIGRPIKWKNINLANFERQRVKIKSFDFIDGVIYIRNGGLIEIGYNFQANSGIHFNPIGGDTVLRLVTYFSTSKIIIGNNVGISNSTIGCYEKIEIEDNVMIGGSVRIWDTDFHSLDPVIRTSGNDTDIRTAPIKICSHAFIGSGSIILKGVTIGRNSIIAAGSVVTKNIPDNVIAGGNPCKIIRPL